MTAEMTSQRRTAQLQQRRRRSGDGVKQSDRNSRLRAGAGAQIEQRQAGARRPDRFLDQIDDVCRLIAARLLTAETEHTYAHTLP